MELGHAILGASVANDKCKKLAKKITSGLCHGMSTRPSAPGHPANDLRKAYTEFGIASSASPTLPRWLLNLSREMRDNTIKLMEKNSGPFAAEVQEIETQKHIDADSNPGSAIHFFLARYEFRCLNAAIEYAIEQGIAPVCDCLDGYLFLAATLPLDKSRDEIAAEMTEHIRAVTGTPPAPRVSHPVASRAPWPVASRAAPRDLWPLA